MNTIEKLKKIQAKNLSHVCVGIDPDIAKIPECVLRRCLVTEKDGLLEFCKVIVQVTAQFVCAFKINSAFFEAKGYTGFADMVNLFYFIQTKYPEHVIIWDAKRGDIGNTSKQYAMAAFEKYNFNADAITVNPLMGFDSISPFLEYKDKLTFILCLTSNKGAEDFQTLPILKHTQPVDFSMLYQKIAEKVKAWNESNNCGLVVGATNPEVEISKIREIIGNDMPILFPGIGAQGGDLEATLKANGGGLFLINSSRGIIFASTEKDFAEKAGEAAQKLRDEIGEAQKSCST